MWSKQKQRSELSMQIFFHCREIRVLSSPIVLPFSCLNSPLILTYIEKRKLNKKHLEGFDKILTVRLLFFHILFPGFLFPVNLLLRVLCVRGQLFPSRYQTNASNTVIQEICSFRQHSSGRMALL